MTVPDKTTIPQRAWNAQEREVIGHRPPDERVFTAHDLYEAYLLGCEDECIPEPLTEDSFLAKFTGRQQPDRLTGTFACPRCGVDTPHRHDAVELALPASVSRHLRDGAKEAPLMDAFVLHIRAANRNPFAPEYDYLRAALRDIQGQIDAERYAANISQAAQSTCNVCGQALGERAVRGRE